MHCKIVSIDTVKHTLTVEETAPPPPVKTVQLSSATTFADNDNPVAPADVPAFTAGLREGDELDIQADQNNICDRVVVTARASTPEPEPEKEDEPAKAKHTHGHGHAQHSHKGHAHAHAHKK